MLMNGLRGSDAGAMPPVGGLVGGRLPAPAWCSDATHRIYPCTLGGPVELAELPA
jgi:hypothetical protein